MPLCLLLPRVFSENHLTSVMHKPGVLTVFMSLFFTSSRTQSNFIFYILNLKIHFFMDSVRE